MDRLFFTSDRIRLCAPTDEDVRQMLVWYEDDVYLRNVDTEPAYPLSKQKIEKQLEETLGAYYFHIRTREENRLIGFVTLHSIEWNNQSANLAIGIGSPSDRGIGLGDEALKLILNYAFMELSLYRVGLEVIAYNKDAVKLYKKNGFIQEGVFREAVYRDNRRFDRIAMSLLREEWLSLSDKS